VARQLLSLGFDAAALAGGYNAWRAAYPVEAKGGVQLARLKSDSSEEVTSQPIILE
jgi:hypothetical protein